MPPADGSPTLSARAVPPTREPRADRIPPRSARPLTALEAAVYGEPDARTVAMREALMASLRNPSQANRDALAHALSLKGPAPRGVFRTLHQAHRDGELP